MQAMRQAKTQKIQAAGVREKPLLAALAGEQKSRPPLWLMRQAGRYLPEYRALREKAGGFLEMVYNPDLAAEATMQPVRRFGMDGAILFSDILVIPQALGIGLRFAEGEGPVLEAVRPGDPLPVFEKQKLEMRLAPVYETVRRVREGLQAESFSDTALIGFAGAPWTVACYMAEGGSSRDFAKARTWAREDAAGFGRLIDLVTEATIEYLNGQISAGAEAIQLFDSWAGLLVPGGNSHSHSETDTYARWVIEPAQRIISAIRARFPDVPIIAFPRGSGELYAEYARQTGADAIGIDQDISPGWAAENLQKKTAVQGNLDPQSLLAGGAEMGRAARAILDCLGGGPFIFNLGHGVIKETPPEHVAQLVDVVRSWRP